jgi:hypothetical protein
MAAVYTTSGALLENAKIVVGSAPSASTTVINLSGSAVFTSATSYYCTVSGSSSSADSNDRWTVQNNSGSQFTVRSTASRPFRFICVGN